MSALELSALPTSLMSKEAKLTLLAVYVFLATVKPHGALIIGHLSVLVYIPIKPVIT